MPEREHEAQLTSALLTPRLPAGDAYDDIVPQQHQPLPFKRIGARRLNHTTTAAVGAVHQHGFSDPFTAYLLGASVHVNTYGDVRSEPRVAAHVPIAFEVVPGHQVSTLTPDGSPP